MANRFFTGNSTRNIHSLILSFTIHFQKEQFKKSTLNLKEIDHIYIKNKKTYSDFVPRRITPNLQNE